VNKLEQKEVEYYTNTVQAWYTTKLEKDKSILTLSSAGLGLISTYLINNNFNTVCELIVIILALISFLVAIISAILIFDANAKYVEFTINDNIDSNAKYLRFLDDLLLGSFILAVVLTTSSVVKYSLDKNNINKKEVISMKKNETAPLSIGIESYDGAFNLKPVEQSSQDKKRSFDGAEKIKPTQPKPPIKDKKNSNN